MVTPARPAAAVGPAEISGEATAVLRPAHADSVPIRGLEALWAETRGDPRIAVALLDGPVDHSHPSLRGANLTPLPTLVSGDADGGSASQHGTHVASLIFGQHDGPVKGVAPGCRGLVLPVFESDGEEAYRPCSQLDLARAIAQAVQEGARIINVSSGELSPSADAWPLLSNVIADCARQGVLIVAAVGNEGCACLHVPAALDSVLAVGAMSAEGAPLPFSNWGEPYQSNGILAPGEEILGAVPGGGVVRRNGTSYATALVSGAAALLLSLQLRRGRPPDARRVREAILRSAVGCEPTTDCRRLLAGRLDLEGAVSIIIRGTAAMSTTTEIQPSDVLQNRRDGPAAPTSVTAPPEAPAPSPHSPPQQSEKPAGSCGCQAGRTAPQYVYALGHIGYDLVSEARLDSLAQKMAGVAGVSAPERVLAFSPKLMLEYLEQNPWDAAAVEWTLSIDGTPVYAIKPVGPFAAEGYRELRRFLHEQLTEGVERVSIPGFIAGKTTLLMGQTVPVVIPEQRGMYSWTTEALVDAVVNGSTDPDQNGREQKRTGVRDFLQRVYHEARNLGVMPQERALNFAATNAFAMGRIYDAAIKDQMELDSIHVVRSPICRPGSDCWDVEVYFFYPERQVQTVRKVYRFTVDVSDIVPVTVGPTRAWFTR
jgi:hypothetical protein